MAKTIDEHIKSELGNLLFQLIMTQAQAEQLSVTLTAKDAEIEKLKAETESLKNGILNESRATNPAA